MTDEPKNAQVTFRVEQRLVDEADALVELVQAQVFAGRIVRSDVLRMALERGLAALRQELESKK